jgi:glucosamine kinase
MILFADSGSTKTDWKLVSTKIIESFQTQGINPVLQTADDIANDQIEHLRKFEHYHVDEIYFYGAGCGLEATQTKMEAILKRVFTNAKVTVDSDLIASAKALFGNKAGIACILGTGSNSGYYDGKRIACRVPPLGFILGDEGGGGQIGKQLLTDYLRGSMPVSLKKYLDERLCMSESELLNKIYQEKFPNRFLGSLVELVVLKFPEDSYIKRTVREQFDRFFNNCINKYDKKNESLGFVGSIAFHFEEILRQAANAHHYTVHQILQKPIDKLIENKLMNK